MRQIALAPSAYAVVLATVLALAGSSSSPSYAQDVSGELVFLNWQTGSEFDTLRALEDAFVTKHPGVRVRNVN